MIRLLTILSILLLSFSANAQKLILNKTVWVGANGDCFKGIYDILPSKNGDILFTGVSQCTTTTGYIQGCPYGGSNNIAIGKLDKDLKPLWVKVYGGSKEDAPHGGLVEMDNGDIFILGKTESTDGDVTGTTGSGDYLWLTKYNKDGDLLWGKVYGCPYADGLSRGSIALTHDNKLIITSSPYGQGGDVPTEYDNSQFLSDAFVFKVDTSGNILWKKVIGGSSADGGDIVISRPDGYYLLCTSSSHDYAFADTGWRKGMPSDETKPDIFVFKLDTSGNTIWGRSYGGSDGEFPFSAFWDDRDNSLVIFGFTNSNDYLFKNHIGNLFLMKLTATGDVKLVKGYTKGHRGQVLSTCEDGYLLFKDRYITNQISDLDLTLLDMNGDSLANTRFGNEGPNLPRNILAPYNSGVVLTGGGLFKDFNYGANIKTFNNSYGATYVNYLNYFPLSVTNTQASSSLIKLYPNPTKNTLHIELSPAISGTTTLTIINTVGKEIHTQKNIDTRSIAIDLSAFAKGIYHITVVDNTGKKHTATFMKN